MKNINRTELINTLQSVTAGLAQRTENIEQSMCFVFKDKKVFTFNEEVMCMADCDIGVEGAIPSMPLLALLSRMKGETVNVSGKKGVLKVEDGRSKAGIKFDHSISLPVDKVEKPGKWHKLPKEFTEAINLTKDCCSRNDLKFELTCVHIGPKYIEATDNVQCARYNLDMGIKSDFLIKANAAANLVHAEVTMFSETTNFVHFKSKSGRVLSCRRYLEKFPNYDSVFKPDGVESFKIPPGLSEAVERASIFTGALASETTDRELVNVDLSKGELSIKGTGTIGWYKETQKIKYKGKDLSFAISPGTLREVARSHTRASLNDQKLVVDGENWRIVFCLFEQLKKE